MSHVALQKVPGFSYIKSISQVTFQVDILLGNVTVTVAWRDRKTCIKKLADFLEHKTTLKWIELLFYCHTFVDWQPE